LLTPGSPFRYERPSYVSRSSRIRRLALADDEHCSYLAGTTTKHRPRRSPSTWSTFRNGSGPDRSELVDLTDATAGSEPATVEVVM
jgi:hypothetical protein